MDNFFGTWKQEIKAKDMKDVLGSTDVTDEVKDNMSNMMNQFVISKSGDDKYSMVHSSENPTTSETYIFALNEPIEGTDIFGKKFKSTFKLENPNRLAEHITEWTDHPIYCTYEIENGDTMIRRTNINGRVCITVLKKIA
ncbi:uncharacterized protein LOC115232460 [Argonauta hians]